MTATRREFLDRLALGAAAIGGLPLALGASASLLEAAAPRPAAPPGSWDLTWVRRITGKHRVVFDVPEIEYGYGVWRASIWARQYQDVLGVPARELSAVLVLRHNAIALAMNQAFWDRYGVGKKKGAGHPLTLEPTDRNPVLLGAKDGMPAPYDAFALDRFLERGGIALACDLAFAECVGLVQKGDGVSAEAARERALAHLVPGVVMQPSGVFAAIHAQDHGCTYLRAS